MPIHRIFAMFAGILAVAMPGGADATTTCSERTTGVAIATFEIELGAPVHLTPVRAVYPTAPGAYPLVLFSHGAYSAGDMYDDLLCAWAEHGYAVFAPTHIDSTKRGTERYDPE